MGQAQLSLVEFRMQSFAFMPDSAGYVAVLHKTDGSFACCVWHKVPRELDVVLEREAAKGVRHVTVGANGAFVVLLNTGVMWWARVPEPLHRVLSDAKRSGHTVLVSIIKLFSQCELWAGPLIYLRNQTVSLSLVSHHWYFVQLVGGTANFSLPMAWHDSINKFVVPKAIAAAHAKGPSIAFAHNQAPPAQAPSSHQAPPAQAPSSHRVPPPLPRQQQQQQQQQQQPRQQQLVRSQQPRPVFNITQVHNHVAPQRQMSALQKYNGMFVLLGGALKLAGAILGPTLLGLNN
jgi:hypothetical protein